MATLDVLVLIDSPTFPGCLLATRLIGILRARQKTSVIYRPKRSLDSRARNARERPVRTELERAG